MRLLLCTNTKFFSYILCYLQMPSFFWTAYISFTRGGGGGEGGGTKGKIEEEE